MITVYPRKPNLAPKCVSPPSAVAMPKSPPSPPSIDADQQPTFYFGKYKEIDRDFLTGHSTTGMIVFAENAWKFFVQIQEFSGQLGDLLGDMNDFYYKYDGDATYALKAFEKNTPCVVTSSEDDVYYRAKVKYFSKKRQTLIVTFVDYGNDDVCKASDAKMLRQPFEFLPMLAVKCKFANCDSSTLPTLDRYAEKFTKTLKELEGQRLTTVFREFRDGVWSVDMFYLDGASVIKRFLGSVLAPAAVLAISPTPPPLTDEVLKTPSTVNSSSVVVLPSPVVPKAPLVAASGPKFTLSSSSSVTNGYMSPSPTPGNAGPKFPEPDMSKRNVDDESSGDDDERGDVLKFPKRRVKKLEVSIVHYVSIDEFYLTESRFMSELNKYESQLSEYYEKRQPTFRPMSRDELASKIVCVAKYCGRWFRCEALSLNTHSASNEAVDPASTPTVDLLRVDYGDVVNVRYENIYPVIDHFKITSVPRFAFCCALKNVCTMSSTDHGALKEHMEEIANRKCLIYGIDPNGRYVVEPLLKNGESVNSFFIKSGLLRPLSTIVYQAVLDDAGSML